ncbi:MAG: hypothetical protein A2X49_08095 [Lentisphaerae bacterium GWF2_52_8]|nr:MAG: hypothetical protein A2X49_08095 [Lentisphaerae bacterium GWF2_52_8]
MKALKRILLVCTASICVGVLAGCAARFDRPVLKNDADVCHDETGPTVSEKPQKSNSKKLIELGWDMKTPAYVCDNISKMEEGSPFDGIIIRLSYGTRGKAGSHIFSTTRIKEEDIESDFKALRNIKWGKFTDNFLALNTISIMDWFSDADWETVCSNVRLHARAAKAGKLKGLMLDPESYGGIDGPYDPWYYKGQLAKYGNANEKSFAEYQAMVRKRGAQFMQALVEEMPDARLLTCFLLTELPGGALDNPDPAKREQTLSTGTYGLLPAFLNGLLDTAGSQIIITDGNERGYYYTSPLEFFQARDRIRQTALRLIAPENLSKYHAHVQVSQPVYPDQLFGLLGRQTVSAHLSPEERARLCEHNAYYALSTSDEYVWVYCEHMDWWKGENLPDGLAKALQSARNKVVEDKPLGYDISQMIKDGKARAKEALNNVVRRFAEIPRIESGPLIDGKPNQDAWKQIKPLEAFVGTTSMPLNWKASVETIARVCYDDMNLYIAFDCSEISPDRMSTDIRDGYGERVYVFISAGEKSPAPYYLFSVNPRNERYAKLGTNKWEGNWKSAVTLDKKGWTAELAIPWSEIKLPVPAAGKSMQIYANLARFRSNGGERTSWSQVGSRFSEPKNFGQWTFR